jgi:glycosyltransferase involved in cell wall biosynthesis
VLLIGRLVDVKGAHLLLQAIPAAARKLGYPLRLTIAGSGPEEPRLRALAVALGLEVDFAGWVSERERLFQEHDLLVVPSLWPEPFGLVGIEAGCAGLPAVAFDTGGISDWLISGQSGELASGKPMTATGLSDAIVRAFIDVDHYNRLRRGAWEQAGRFRIDSHIRQLEEIFAEVAGAMEVEHAAAPTRAGL